MKALKIGILIFVFAILVAGIYNLKKDNAALRNDLLKISSEVQALQEENVSLVQDITYLKRPENLLKELKSQFNYKEVGESLIILVPAPSSATSTNTGN